MNTNTSNFLRLFSASGNWVNVIVKLVFLVLLFLVLNPSSCKKEDVGKCTISTHSGDKQVYDDISIEECQNIFGNTIGGKGWEWEPNN